MAAILQTAFSNSFSCMGLLYLNLPRVRLTISHHWFRYSHGDKPSSERDLLYGRIYAPFGLHALSGPEGIGINRLIQNHNQGSFCICTQPMRDDVTM